MPKDVLTDLEDLAARFAEGASDRDRDRRLPHAEVEELSDSGFFGWTVPHRFGGPDVDVPTLVEAFRLLSAADPNIGQIPQSHFVFLEALRLGGDEDQQRRFFGEAREGRRFANAQTERGTRTITEDRTTLSRRPDGDFVLDGEKFYATGSLFADWLAVRATLPEDPPLPSGGPAKAIAYLPADAEGVTIEDDWDAMGQRTTGSGTVRLHQVAVPAGSVVPFSPIFTRPTAYGSFAQVMHAAIDAGVARAALTEAVKQVAKARPWFEAGVERAADDPLLAQQAGELEITVRGAEALLREAAVRVDEARTNPSAGTTETATLATAVAKVASARASTEAASMLFELAGTRSALGALNLSRFWRDARTHTLHDPTRWKVQHIGRWLLTDTPPPRHGLL